MENLTENQLSAISHSLGIDLHYCKTSKRKKDKFLPDQFYRNYYCYRSEDSILCPEFKELEELGYIETWVKFTNLMFNITEKGIVLFREYFQDNITNTYVPLSKAKADYQRYCDHDYGNFSDYLGIKMPKVEYIKYMGFGARPTIHENYSKKEYGNLRRYISTKYTDVKGEFKPTAKEAKTSYKEALKKYKALNK